MFGFLCQIDDCKNGYGDSMQCKRPSKNREMRDVGGNQSFTSNERTANDFLGR